MSSSCFKYNRFKEIRVSRFDSNNFNISLVQLRKEHLTILVIIFNVQLQFIIRHHEIDIRKSIRLFSEEM